MQQPAAQPSMTDQTPSPSAPQPLMDSSASAPKKNSKPMALLGGFIAIIIVALFILYGFTVRQVKALSEAPHVLTLANAFHVPAARINGIPIPYTRYIGDIQVLRHFIDQNKDQIEASGGVAQIPQSDKELSDITLSRLAVNALIADMAKEYDVKVTDEDLAKEKEKLMQGFDSETALSAEIQKNYVWDLPTYIQNVVEPVVLEDKVRAAFEAKAATESDEFTIEEVRARHILFKTTGDVKKDKEAEKKANEVLARIKKGEDFATLAKEFGSDATKEQGGDLGFFPRGAMVPEFEAAAFSLEPGKVSDSLVKSQFGYHIIKVEEKRRRRDFVQYMNEKIRTAKFELTIPVSDPFASFRNAPETPVIDTSAIPSTSTQQ